MFTIQSSTAAPQKEVDLVAATTDGKCDDNGSRNAVAINITDTILKAPADLNWLDRDTCVPTPNTTSAFSQFAGSLFDLDIFEFAASMFTHYPTLRSNSFDPPENALKMMRMLPSPWSFSG
ncbi:hypothetical protein BDV11DRAFT_187395 [Aspergillus similis]